jgi:hypothetical protein
VVSEDGDRALADVVSTVMVYLAAHPERRRRESTVSGDAASSVVSEWDGDVVLGGDADQCS